MQATVAAGVPGTKPERRLVQGTPVVTYRRARVWMDRDAWEMLPEDGLLVPWIVPTAGDPFVLALTHRELHEVFGEVIGSRSWDEYRCWHFPREPLAARAFKVRLPDAVPLGSSPRRSSERTQGPARSRSKPAPADPLALVAAHLAIHKRVSEAQLVTLLGSTREYRKVQRQRDDLPLPPNTRLDVQATAEGTFWRLVPA